MCLQRVAGAAYRHLRPSKDGGEGLVDAVARVCWLGGFAEGRNREVPGRPQRDAGLVDEDNDQRRRVSWHANVDSICRVPGNNGTDVFDAEFHMLAGAEKKRLCIPRPIMLPLLKRAVFVRVAVAWLSTGDNGGVATKSQFWPS